MNKLSSVNVSRAGWKNRCKGPGGSSGSRKPILRAEGRAEVTKVREDR